MSREKNRAVALVEERDQLRIEKKYTAARLEKSKRVRHLFHSGRAMERNQACEQSADRSHWCYNDPRMRSSFSQIRLVECHKVTDVVCDDHTSLDCGFLQDHRVCGALPLEVINAVGIYAPLP